MFRHHKYCVVEIAGLLVAHAGTGGIVEMYLLDGVDDIDRAPATANRTAPQRVDIVDADLAAYIRNHFQPTDGQTAYRLKARVAGSIHLENGLAQLSSIGHASLDDGAKVLVYEPMPDT